MRQNLCVSPLILAALAFTSDARATERSPASDKSPVAIWPQWRGPHQDGRADDTRVPMNWDQNTNLKWQIDLPGLGHSSPVVWGDRVFLTAATKSGSERWVLCIDKSSGKILWQQTAVKGLAAEPVHAWNTHASATCATDGERLYAFFGTPGIFCYDFKGKLLWKKDFGPLVAATGWGGGAASPVLFENLVFVNGDHGSYRGQQDDKGIDHGPSWLWALNKHNGKVVWKAKRNQGMGWGTPVLWNSGARLELVLNGQLGVWSYDPRSGKELWHVMGRAADEGFGEVSPVWGHDQLYIFTGKPGPAWAIRPGGSGDVSNSHVAWHIKRKDRDVSSPVLIGDHIYTLSRTGIATCLVAQSGKEVWRDRLDGQPCASLIALRGNPLFLSDDGTAFLVEAGVKFKLLHRNKLGDGDEFRASPAVVDGQLLIRSDRRLYCIEDAQKTTTGNDLKSKVRILEGHTGSVLGVQFAPDDKVLASCCRDKTIKLWEPKTGKLLRTLTEHSGDVYDVDFSAKGDLLASGGKDKVIRLWDTKTWKVIRTFAGHEDIVRSVAFSPDQKTLASSSVDRTVRLWDVDSGKWKQTLKGHTARVMSVALSPDGNLLASASSDSTARVWDARSGELKRTLKGHDSGLECIDFSPDSKWLVSSSQDTTVRIWDAATGEVRHVLKGHTSEIDCVRFSPDGKMVASGCKDKTIKFWDAASGKLLRTLTGHTGRIESIAFSRDGLTLATGGGGGDTSVRLWRLEKEANGP